MNLATEPRAVIAPLLVRQVFDIIRELKRAYRLNTQDEEVAAALLRLGIVPGPAMWWARPSALSAAAAVFLALGISLWLWFLPPTAAETRLTGAWASRRTSFARCPVRGSGSSSCRP